MPFQAYLYNARQINRHMQTLSNRVFWTACTLALSASAWSADFIAGTEPAQRPAGAPVIQEHQLSPDELGKRLHGVADPLPTNVVNAALAGAWFMPLAHPGMTPPYDIRGWHGAKASPTSTSKQQ